MIIKGRPNWVFDALHCIVNLRRVSARTPVYRFLHNTTMASTDQLQSIATKSVVVHPLVLLSIQDHAARVAKGTKKRVIGILLGQDLGPRGINVANSFAGENDRRSIHLSVTLADRYGCSSIRGG